MLRSAGTVPVALHFLVGQEYQTCEFVTNLRNVNVTGKVLRILNREVRINVSPLSKILRIQRSTIYT